MVRLTLKTGTVIIDTGDRITLQGATDDISVAELVACVERRGWRSVELTGDGAFREDAARRLMRLSPPVEVANNPLDPAERAAIRVEVSGEDRGVDWGALAAAAPVYAPR